MRLFVESGNDPLRSYRQSRSLFGRSMPLRFLDIAGQRLAVITVNDERPEMPIVFIHGITTSVTLWESSLPALVREGRRWISLSLPGHAPSELDAAAIGGWDKVTPLAWVEWYEEALRQLVGDQPVALVGWSTGGFTALALAAKYPQRVHSVLSICGFATGRWFGLIGLLQRMSHRSLTRLLVRFWLTRLVKYRWLFYRIMEAGIADRKAFRSSPAYEESLDSWLVAFRHQDTTVMTNLFRVIAGFDVSSWLSDIRCPVLIAGGEADPYIPFAEARRLAAQIPGAELVSWPGAGHLFFAERTEEYQRLLIRWLDQTT